jgi:flagellin-like hook-associated protein FlgL
MTYQNFVCTCAIQIKNQLNNSIRRIVIVSLLLSASCSFVKCATDGTESTISNNITSALNVVNFCKALLNLCEDQLDAMKILATSAGEDSASAASRATADVTYQSRLSCISRIANTTYNNIALFSGGSNSVVRLGAMDAFGVTGLAVTTDISSSIGLDGFVAGAIESLSVETSDTNSALVTALVGGQSLKGTISMNVIGAVQLISTTDSTNSMTLHIVNSGFSSNAQIEAELKTLFQLDILCPIAVRSASTDLSAAIAPVTVGTSTAAGNYGLSYSYDTNTNSVTYKLTNGLQKWENTYDVLNTNARVIDFENGLTITKAVDVDETQPISGVEFLNVIKGDQVILNTQVGTQTSEIFALTLASATLEAFNLAGTHLSDQASALSAASAIDTALIQVRNMNTQIGGGIIELGCMSSVCDLKTQFGITG